MKLLKSGVMSLMLLTAAGSLGRAQQAVFNFDADPVNTTATAFTDTDALTGLTATFSSNNDPAGFIVDNSQLGFVSFSGPNDLNENQTGGKQFGTLTISFNKQVNDFFLNFALNDFGVNGDPLNLIALLGGVQVGQASGFGQVPAGGNGYPEGTLAYGGSPFDSITLSTPINLFAIDNVSVQTVIPEPGTISLLLLGTGCVLFGVWRRNRSQVLCQAAAKVDRSSIA